MQALPLQKVVRQKADGALAACDRLLNVVQYQCSTAEVADMVADAVAARFQQFENADSVRIVIFRAEAEEHVIIHVLSVTFVPVERMKLPPGVQSNSQAINSEADHQQDDRGGQRT